MPFIDKQVIPWDLVLSRINCAWVFKILELNSRLLFNESLTSMALSILQEYVRSGILCVLLCAELDAMVRKLTSLICFDIFQSKWYRNALIANTIFGTSIKAFRCHFDWKMSKLIFLISFDIFQSKWHRNGFNCKHYFWHINQSIPISLWLKNVKTDILDIFWHFSIKVTLERL